MGLPAADTANGIATHGRVIDAAKSRGLSDAAGRCSTLLQQLPVAPCAGKSLEPARSHLQKHGTCTWPVSTSPIGRLQLSKGISAAVQVSLSQCLPILPLMDALQGFSHTGEGRHQELQPVLVLVQDSARLTTLLTPTGRASQGVPQSAFTQSCQQRYLRSFTASTSGQLTPQHGSRRAVAAQASACSPPVPHSLSSPTPFSGVPVHSPSLSSGRPTATR